MSALAISNPPEPDQARPVQAAPALTSYRQRAAELTIKVYEDRYHFHPQEHPLVQYLHALPLLQQRRQREQQREDQHGLQPEEVYLYLTQNWGEVNAFALPPNQSIIISDRVFSFCQYQEELEFILQHELTHLREGCGKEKVFGSVGRNRFAEYQADLENILKEKEQSLNPAGGIVFLQRLADQEKQKQGQKQGKNKTYDLEHGDTFVRLMNMEYALRIVDLDALTADLSPIPEELRRLPTPITLTSWDYFEGHFPKTFVYHFHQSSAEVLLPAAQQIGLVGVFENLGKLYGSTNLEPLLQKELQKIFSRKIGEGIKPYVLGEESGNENGNESIVDAISSFLVGTLAKEALLVPLLSVFSQPTEFSDFIRSLHHLPASLPIQFQRPPKVKLMLAKLEESYALPEACSNAELLVDTFKKLYVTFGNASDDEKQWKEANTALVLLNLKRFSSRKEGMSQYLNWLEKQEFVLADEEILLALGDYFSLSQQQVEQLSEQQLFRRKTATGAEEILITPAAREKVELVNQLVKRFYRHEEKGNPELLWRKIFEIITPASLEELNYFFGQTEQIEREGGSWKKRK